MILQYNAQHNLPTCVTCSQTVVPPKSTMAYNNTEQNGPPSTDGPTWRAVITGIGLIILLILGIGYADNVIGGSYLAADHTNIGAVAMLFLILVVFNPLISYLVGRARRLSRGEILTIYLMLVLSSSVVSLGLVSNIIPMISGAFYHAKGNRYQELFHPYLPGHLTVRDPGALKEYYEGKLRKTVELPARPQAGGLSSIAWRLRCWSIKAAAWKDWLAERLGPSSGLVVPLPPEPAYDDYLRDGDLAETMDPAGDSCLSDGKTPAGPC